MYVATEGLNAKFGSPISSGGARHHCPPACDGPAQMANVMCKSAQYAFEEAPNGKGHGELPCFHRRPTGTAVYN